jgi:acyl-coenzyme A thioesterase PaaI-like protein
MMPNILVRFKPFLNHFSMKKIRNPWQDENIFHCFGCDAENPIGLKLRFFEEGDALFCTWTPHPHYQGYVNTLHGGIHSTLHDEIAGWVVYVKGKTAGMTQHISVSFIKPVLIDGSEIKLTGSIVEKTAKTLKIKTQLFNSQGILCSEGLVEYRIFPNELAIKKLYYPGSDAFYYEQDLEK